MTGVIQMPVRLPILTANGSVVVLEFPDSKSAGRFQEAMARIRETGDDPALWWEDVYGQFGGRVVME